MDASNSAVIDAFSSRKSLPIAKRQYRSPELKRQIGIRPVNPSSAVEVPA